MLYFDQEETNHVGTIRQQFWALLHFPFHVCILLVVEGLSRFSIWVKVIDVLNPYTQAFSYILQNTTIDENSTTGGPTGEHLTHLVELYNESTLQLFEKWEAPKYAVPNITDWLNYLEHSDGNAAQFQYGAFNIYNIGFQFVTDNLGINAPESYIKNDQALAGIFALFYTVFLYFFIAAGLTLVILAVLYVVGKRRKLRGEVFSIAFRILVGVGLCLLAFMDLPSLQSQDNSAINTYLYSPWLLPTVVLAYGLGSWKSIPYCVRRELTNVTVLLVDNLLINYVRMAVRGRKKEETSTVV